MNSKGRVRLRSRRLLSNSLPDVTAPRSSKTPPPPASLLSSSNPNSPSKAATDGSYKYESSKLITRSSEALLQQLLTHIHIKL